MTTPTGRYPDKRRRVGVLIASGLIGAIALGWLGWVIWDNADPEVRSSLRTWEVQDEHETSFTLDVRLRDEDVAASCLLRAFAEDHSTVGETNLKVSAGDTRQIVAGSIRTERRATSVELVSCEEQAQN